MTRLAFRIAANTSALYVASLLFPAVVLSSAWAGLLAGTVLTLLNVLVRPFLMLITLPINLLTLGLFTLVINAWLVLLAAKLIAGVTVAGFWPALVTGLVVTLVNLPLTHWFRNRRYVRAA